MKLNIKTIDHKQLLNLNSDIHLNLLLEIFRVHTMAQTIIDYSVLIQVLFNSLHQINNQ
jgi:hypothetical protein